MYRKVLLIFIVLIAVLLRFYGLGEVPVSPDWDEAALGYNAYSILKTGRDEYGYRLPLSIRSFDDYKPPLYVYLTVPSVALFDLSVWSTRLPSAIFGVLAVMGTYLMVGELLRVGQTNSHSGKSRRDASRINSKNPDSGQAGMTYKFGNEAVPMLSSFLLAISPWHIQFSRIAFEANIGVTINIWAGYFFLKSITRKLFLLPAAVLFGLGFYAYHSERLFLPLLVVLLAVTFRNELFTKSRIKTVLAAIVIGIMVVTPLVPVIFNKTALLRLRGTSSFTDQTGLLAKTIDRLEYHRSRGEKLGEFLDNRRFIYVTTILNGYLSHYSPKWLFLEGDNPRHHAVDMGLLYLWELPFVLIGLFSVIRNGGKLRSVLLGWFLLAPVAASPTTEVPHGIRTLLFLPTFQVFTAIGLLAAKDAALSVWKDYVSKIFIRRLVFAGAVSVFALFVAFNFFYYLSNYFIHMNHEVAQYWQYGMREAVEYTEQHKYEYDQVVVSTTLEQSYMFFLFFTKFDPVKYLALGGTKTGGFDEENNAFDRYIFRKLDWPNEKRDDSLLFLGNAGELSKYGDKKVIYNPDGTKAVLIGARN